MGGVAIVLGRKAIRLKFARSLRGFLSIHSWRQLERLARPELFAHQRQAQNPALKAVREAREERRFLLVFEKIELADDEVALLAGANQLVEARG